MEFAKAWTLSPPLLSAALLITHKKLLLRDHVLVHPRISGNHVVHAGISLLVGAVLSAHTAEAGSSSASTTGLRG